MFKCPNKYFDYVTRRIINVDAIFLLCSFLMPLSYIINFSESKNNKRLGFSLSLNWTLILKMGARQMLGKSPSTKI